MFLPGGLLWPKSNLSSESTRDEHDPSTGYDFLGSDTLTRANTDNSTIRNNLQDVWPLAEEGSFRQAVTHNEIARNWFNNADYPNAIQSSSESLQYMVAKCGFVSNNCSSVCDCDLLWRDPRSHGLEPDKGLAMWGDPDITNSRPIRNWLVGEGEEEDLEDAIARNPCIDESQDSEDMTKMAGGDSVQTWPFPFPKPNAKRIVTGWSDCEKDCGNHSLSDSWNRYESTLGLVLAGRSTENFMSQNGNQIGSRQDLQSAAMANFINFLRSQVLELQVMAMTLHRMINQVSVGNVSEEQVQHLLYHAKEEEWRRFAVGVNHLKMVMTNILTNFDEEQRRQGKNAAADLNSMHKSRFPDYNTYLM